MKNIEKGALGNLKYEFDISKRKLEIIHNGQTYEKELLDTKNGKLIQAFRQGKVYLDAKENELFYDKTLYYCSRSILKIISSNTEVYMDVLIYNDDRNVIYQGALNRSQGHCNKAEQVEYHQVLDGEIISVTTSPNGKSYYGFFKKGDYIHIPKGWFHCTYVVKAPAVVANFYCNTPWGDHVECKPYFEISNDFCFEYGQSLNEFILKKRGQSSQILISKERMETFEDMNLFTYQDLQREKLVRVMYPCENIFDFIYQLDLEQE